MIYYATTKYIMYFSTYFPLSWRGDVAIFLFWFGWGFVELVDIVAYVFHDTAWTLVKPHWGGGGRRIQSNLVRIQLDLSFRVVFSRIWGVSSRIWGVSSWVWGVSSRIWGVSSWVWGCWKISMGVLKIFNRGVGHLRFFIQWGYWKGSMGAVRQGLGFGSDRGVAVGQTGVWL